VGALGCLAAWMLDCWDAWLRDCRDAGLLGCLIAWMLGCRVLVCSVAGRPGCRAARTNVQNPAFLKSKTENAVQCKAVGAASTGNHA